MVLLYTKSRAGVLRLPVSGGPGGATLADMVDGYMGDYFPCVTPYLPRRQSWGAGNGS